MPIFAVGQIAQQTLISNPESGMGFQIFWYRGDLLLALNATLIIPLVEIRRSESAADQIAVLLSDTGGELRPGDSIDLIDDFRLAFSQLEPEITDPATGLNTLDIAAAPPINVISPKRPYSYYRFSAAPRDRRILPNGDFLPGTYATTYPDFHFVPSGYAAVGRYALPNPASARFVFQIVTYDRPTKMGTATPNFGQAGGGVEVLFGTGAKHGTQLSFMIDAG